MPKGLALLNRHRALFLTSENGEVRPALLEGVPEADVYATGNAFFAWNASYDLVRQWTVEEGAFSFAFDWHGAQHAREAIEAAACEMFERQWQVSPRAFKVL